MAESDWSFCEDGLDINTVDRGATAGIAPPPGGRNFVFGFNSLMVATGAVAKFFNGDDFAPAAKGGSIRGALKRGASGGLTGWSPQLFIGLQGPSVNDHCYMLGLSDEDPHRILLRKGDLAGGLRGASGSGVLRASTATYANNTWLHLRLDMIVNDNGDVVLNVFQNDIANGNEVDSPAWVAIPGMASFIDDQLGVNTGSQPLTSGRMGVGYRCSDTTRRAFFDQVEIYRQL